MLGIRAICGMTGAAPDVVKHACDMGLRKGVW